MACANHTCFVTDPNEPGERRRVVLHPRTAAARRFDRSSGNTIHVRGHTVDSDEVEDLLGTLLRSSIRYLAVIFVPLVALMVTIALFPSVRSARPFGLAPLPWLLVGPVTLFSITAAAFFHERRTVQRESRWSKSHSETRP